MPKFAGKVAPDDDKLRGGYYTPAVLAKAVADWVAEAGPTLLEPSCGDGRILKHLVARAGDKAVVGVELLASEAEAARATGAEVTHADFFSWFVPTRFGTFDGVAGNPPYIRFGNWGEVEREPALALMRSQGLKLTRLTNAWVPFVVASVLAVRDGGRVGLVLPAELLQVGYATSLRSHLADNCAHITLVSFRKLVFSGILQEVVLLLAEKGPGPAAIRTIELDDASGLGSLNMAVTDVVQAPLHDGEKWTKYYLSRAQIKLLRDLRADERLVPLGRVASVDVGVVTGRNSFFTMTPEEAAERNLTELTAPLVSRSQQLRGVRVTEDDLRLLLGSTARTRLLDVPPTVTLADHVALNQYVRAGEAELVHEGYKCRIRKDWWRVPSVSVPDGFMLRQIHRHPRVFANAAGATSTDTVHRVRLLTEDVTVTQLAVAALNSASFAMTEIVGRSYGGGLLELEPNEAEHLPVPPPALVSCALVAKVDELLREDRLEDAVRLVDQELLVDALGFRTDEVAAFNGAWARLRDRRGARAKSSH